MMTTRLVQSALFRRGLVARCQQQASRSSAVASFHSSPILADNDDLPYHIVVGMPALSPTMETGILAEWYVSEGSEFSAGQSLAKIETDKASIDFEAQDDGVVAKILMDAGNGEDVAVGTPIMVTIEEMEDLEAFKDFQLEEEEAASPEPEPEAPKVEAAVPPPPAAAAAAPPPPAPVAAVEPEPVAAVESLPPAVEEALVASIAPVMSTGWGEFAKLNSPILKTLSKQQREYVEKYGTTGQVPL